MFSSEHGAKMEVRVEKKISNKKKKKVKTQQPKNIDWSRMLLSVG
jgi:hypothetical protein